MISKSRKDILIQVFNVLQPKIRVQVRLLTCERIWKDKKKLWIVWSNKKWSKALWSDITLKTQEFIENDLKSKEFVKKIIKDVKKNKFDVNNASMTILVIL